MRRLLALAGLMLLPAAAGAATPTVFTLQNGLQVLVLEDHRAPVVEQMVWYKIGAADERRGVSGIAHFLEHLMFQGTDTMKPGELSQTVARNGGTDNAFTTEDYTAYFQRVAADRLELMMQMESDRMRHLKLSQEDVDTERQVILEERNMRIDNDPGQLFNEQMMAAMYLNSPYGTPVIGWRQEMQALTRDEALDWYHRYYAPNNAILIVAGDVQPDQVRALAQQYYGALQPTPGLGPRLRPQEPPQLAERRLSMSDARVSQPYLLRLYLVPQRSHADQATGAALTLLAALLGGTPATSVLGRALQFDHDVAVYSSAWYGGVSYDPTTFAFAVVPAQGVTLADAEAALDRTLAGFVAKGIDDDQWQRVRSQIKANLIYQEDDIDHQANRYGAALTSGLTVADVAAWPEALQAVTKDQVIAAARKYLDRSHSVTGWLMPAPGAADPGQQMSLPGSGAEGLQ
jgi:zinc protease